MQDGVLTCIDDEDVPVPGKADACFAKAQAFLRYCYQILEDQTFSECVGEFGDTFGPFADVLNTSGETSLCSTRCRGSCAWLSRRVGAA